MKRLWLIPLIMLAIPAGADVIDLTKTETLSVPTSYRMLWNISLIDGSTKRLHVDYWWMDADGKAIPVEGNRTGKNTWVCMDAEVDDPATPYNDTTCFSSIFGFRIRQADVGQKLGVGLRTLVWNKFKGAVLKTPDNAGVFDND